MEHIEGVSLEEALARSGLLPEAEVLSWFDRLLAAVEYLHAQRPSIVHGSISPASIIIASDGTPQLADLASPADPDERDDAASGTPEDSPFVAPEQHLGEVDQRTDTYALGATLYTVLTGQRPPGALARGAGQQLPAPRQINQAISPAVDAAVVKAMALSPQQRFGSPAELWRALQKPPAKPSKGLPVMLAAGVGLVGLLLALFLLWRLLPPLLSEALHLARSISLGLAQPEPTAAPPATSTVRPTVLLMAPTWVPTAATFTPTATPTAVAQLAVATPARTPKATPPTAEPRPAQRWFPAPVPLLAAVDPAAGQVEFRWYWNETLLEDEYFDLQVWALGTPCAGIAWCKEPYYRTALLPGSGGDYVWRVQVIRGVHGQVLGTVTDPSAERSLEWHPRGN